MMYPSIQNTCDVTAAVTCYNEQDLVIETLETLVASLREFDFTWEIVVIDDASTDASAEKDSPVNDTFATFSGLTACS